MKIKRLTRFILLSGTRSNLARLHDMEAVLGGASLNDGFCAFEGEEVRREPFSAFQAIVFAQCLNTSRVWLTLNGVNLHRDCARRWLKSLVPFPEQFRENLAPVIGKR